jgi:transposase
MEPGRAGSGADAAQRRHSRRELFNGLRDLVRHGIGWRALPTDLPPWAAGRAMVAPNASAARSGIWPVDTLGHWLAPPVTPCVDDRAEVRRLAAAVPKTRAILPRSIRAIPAPNQPRPHKLRASGRR